MKRSIPSGKLIAGDYFFLAYVALAMLALAVLSLHMLYAYSIRFARKEGAVPTASVMMRAYTLAGSFSRLARKANQKNKAQLGYVPSLSQSLNGADRMAESILVQRARRISNPKICIDSIANPARSSATEAMKHAREYIAVTIPLATPDSNTRSLVTYLDGVGAWFDSLPPGLEAGFNQHSLSDQLDVLDDRLMQLRGFMWKNGQSLWPRLSWWVVLFVVDRLVRCLAVVILVSYAIALLQKYYMSRLRMGAMPVRAHLLLIPLIPIILWACVVREAGVAELPLRLTSSGAVMARFRPWAVEAGLTVLYSTLVFFLSYLPANIYWQRQRYTSKRVDGNRARHWIFRPVGAGIDFCYAFFLRDFIHSASVLFGLSVTILGAAGTSLLLAGPALAAPVLHDTLRVIPIPLAVAIASCIILLTLVAIRRLQSILWVMAPVVFIAIAPVIAVRLFEAIDIWQVLFRFQQTEIDPLLALTFAGGAISAIGLWLLPIVSGVNSIEDVFERQTLVTLRGIFNRASRHTVVLGFGDFGSHVVTGVSRSIKAGNGNTGTMAQHRRRSSRHRTSPESTVKIVSSRTWDMAEVRTDLIAVDISAAAFAEVHHDPLIGAVGLGETKPHKRGDNLLTPGIIGDCRSSLTLSMARIEEASLVVLATRDPATLLPVYQAIHKRSHTNKPLTAVLGAEDGTFIQFLEWKDDWAKVFFIYPAKLRGSAIGRIAFCHLMAQPNTERPVLLLGNGKQVYYIIEKIWLELRRFCGDNKAQSFLDSLCIVSEAEFLLRAVIPGSTGFFPRLVPFGARKAMLPLLHRSGMEGPHAKVTLLPCSPANVALLSSLVTVINPGLVLVAAETHSETIRITQETVLALERSTPPGQPVANIVVGTRTEDRPLVKDALHYLRRLGTPSNRLPIPCRDTAVSLYDDIRAMLAGLVETSMSARPVETALCTVDDPGTLIEISRRLSGFQLSEFGKESKLLPSFHDYRASRLTNGHFCFRSIASLHEAVIQNTNCPDQQPLHCMVSAGDTDQTEIMRLLHCMVSAGDTDQTEIMRLLGLAAKQNWESPPRMPRNCGLSGIARHLYCSSPSNTELTRRIYSGTLPCAMTNHRNARSIVPNTPLAEFTMCGNLADMSGTLCRALAVVLMGRADPIKGNGTQCVLDIRYADSQTCYHADKTLKRFYGRLVEPVDAATRSRRFPLREIAIRRLGEQGWENWKGYARSLVEHLGRIRSRAVTIGEETILISFEDDGIAESRLDPGDCSISCGIRCAHAETPR